MTIREEGDGDLEISTAMPKMGNVLVVDDNEDLLLAVRMFLRDHAAQVDIESDPRQIPRHLQRKPYELILLDMNFRQDTTSGKEGFFWLQQIRESNPEVVVVLITGYGDVEMAVKAVKKGATDFVLKPFANEKLLRTCQQAIAQEKSRNQKNAGDDLQTATRVQRHLFPQTLPAFKSLDYTATCQSVQGTGGDYYDFLLVEPRKLGMALGDVCGKGISAALLMANLQGRLQSFAPLRVEAVDKLVSDINQSMCQATESSRYATFFYGVYDEGRRSLTYVNAGHHAPMLFRDHPTAPLQRLETGGMVIGLFPDAPYEQETISLLEGDVLVYFTDGLVEARNPRGEEFGESRIAASVSPNLTLGASGIRDLILRSLEDFSDGTPLDDDLTLVVVKIR